MGEGDLPLLIRALRVKQAWDERVACALVLAASLPATQLLAVNASQAVPILGKWLKEAIDTSSHVKAGKVWDVLGRLPINVVVLSVTFWSRTFAIEQPVEPQLFPHPKQPSKLGKVEHSRRCCSVKLLLWKPAAQSDHKSIAQIWKHALILQGRT